MSNPPRWARSSWFGQSRAHAGLVLGSDDRTGGTAAITVLVVQNGQGFAVLKAAGHEPPIEAVTVACGVGSMLGAVVGSVSTCLTGPTNAIITSSCERARHYIGAAFWGLVADFAVSWCLERRDFKAPMA